MHLTDIKTISSSFAIKRSWGMVSQVLNESIETPPTTRLLSRPAHHSSNKRIKTC